MNTVKCRCGFDSYTEHPKGSFSVGEFAAKLNMVWIALQDGGSTWICRECAEKASKAADLITEIVGSDNWIARSVRRTHTTNQR